MAESEVTTIKEIPLTCGKAAIVDAVDYDWLNERRWHFNNTGYAVRTEGSHGSSRAILMHRQIVEAPVGMQVDHINGDRLDNRRSNLRLCTAIQNNWNSKPRTRTNRSSAFKGVSWGPSNQAWIARIQKDGKLLRIGQFQNEEEAARAYDAKAVELFGEFARLNFDQG